MSYCDFDPATVYNETTPRARKPYRCDECDGGIRVGERYQRVFGVWDGCASTFRTCMDCVALWCDVRRTTGTECGAIHGGLVSEIDEVWPLEQRERLRAAFAAARSERP